MTEQHKRTATIIVIVTSLFPSIVLIPLPSLISLKSISLYVSAILGYMGIVLLLWMYMLGTRAVTGLVFSDLAPVLQIHKWLGKYGTIAIFIHPVLVTYSYGESWFFAAMPQVGTVAERHILLGQIALWVLALTWGVSAFLRHRMAFRPWKYLHYLAYICIPFALLHVPDLGSQAMTHSAVKAYLFTLGITFLVFTILRLRSLLNLDRRIYTVMSHVPLTDARDYTLRVKPSQSSWLKSPQRGQYIYIKLGYLSEDHPFSIVQYDDASGEITLAYRIAGMYTKELAKLTAGHPVYLSGPYGSFTANLAESDTTPVVYLAGGIGVTPFADRILSENDVREQWLFAANRSPETAVLISDLKKELGAHCISVYSDAPQQLLAAGEERGIISASLLGKYLTDPGKYRYYLCGPVPMMSACRDALAELGVPSAAVHSESFGW